MKYFEDYRVGEAATFGSRTVTEQEILAFARRYDPQPFHTDPEVARRSIFGSLIASGWHTCGIMMRLTVDAMESESARSLGSPGVDACRWLQPVRAGDTVTMRREVLETWPSKSKPYGFVKTRTVLDNQRGEPVLEAVSIGMFARRDGGTA